MCAGGCKPRLGRDWERGGPSSLGQHYKKGLLGPAHPPNPREACLPSLHRLRAQPSSECLWPVAFFSPGLGSNTQCFMSLSRSQ